MSIKMNRHLLIRITMIFERDANRVIRCSKGVLINGSNSVSKFNFGSYRMAVINNWFPLRGLNFSKYSF